MRAGRAKALLAPFVLALCTPAIARDQVSATLADWTDGNLVELVEVYKDLHANAELSLQEARTGEVVAKALEECGYTVPRGLSKTGVIGVLKNGDGPTILIRGDMDALPMTEKTGVPCASKVKVRKSDGKKIAAMHACGHDVHSTMIIGVGRFLVSIKDQWKVTIVLAGQPAEEITAGASRMIEEGIARK